MRGVKAVLRDARYALPGRLGRLLPAPDAQSVARLARRLERRGIGVTTGYIPGPDAEPTAVAAENIAVITLLAGRDGTPYLSAKLPTLAFDEPAFATIAQAADSAAMPLLFDAHALKDAGPIHAYLAALLPEQPGTGIVLPARWRRSLDDAARLRDTTARLRIVKGEWADPDWPDCDMDHAYRAGGNARGRSAPVAVATHKPELADHALRTCAPPARRANWNNCAGCRCAAPQPSRASWACRFASISRSAKGGGPMRSTRRSPAPTCRCGCCAT
jgi:proline dehydrogenase